MRNISLQRSRADFETQQMIRSHKPRVQNTFNLNQPILNPIYTQNKIYRSSTPLSSRILSLPPEIEEFCQKQQIPYQLCGFDCSQQFYWLSVQNAFFLWRYRHIRHWGTKSPEPELIFFSIFPQAVCVAKVGIIKGYEHNSQAKILVLAVALSSKIKFFKYNSEKQLFQDMKLEVNTNGQIVHNMVFFEGNIYYGGSHGSLKTVFNKLGFFRKNNNFKMKTTSLLSDTIINSMLFWKTSIKSSSLVIIQNHAYMLVEKKYPNSWIAKQLLYKKQISEETILKVFDIRTNQLIKQITEQTIIDKAKFKTTTNVDFVRKIKIIGLFKKNDRLGISFSSGMFAFLNESCLMIQDTFLVPFVQPRNIVADKINRQFDIAGIITSLGIQNLSVFQDSGVGYVDNHFFDICNSMKGKQILNIVQLPSKNLYYSNTMFQQPKQWMCLNSYGITQIKKLRLQQIILVYLHILSHQKSIRNNICTFQPFNYLCRLYTNIDVCTHIMEIICNNNIEVQLQQQAYQNTRRQIFKINNLQIRFDQKSYLKQNAFLTQIKNRHIKINQDIIKIAAQILNYISSQNLNTGLDILWKSILKYFNNIYSIIKYQTPSWCIVNFQIVQSVKYKLQCFKKLLYIKSLQFNMKDWKYQDDTFNFNTTRLNDYIPPIGSQTRQKYDTNTPILIIRTKQLIDRIYCLLQVCGLLSYNIYDEEQPNIHQILTNNRTRNSIRSRIFKDIKPDHPIIMKIIKVFPELLNNSDQIFNQFILNPKNKTRTFSLEDLVPTLKTERIPVIKEYFYKQNRVYDFIVLLLQRMKYLQLEKHRVKGEINNKQLPFLTNDIDQEEVQIQQLQNNWTSIVPELQKSVKEYIKHIRNNKTENRLELLGNYVQSLQIEPLTLFIKELFLEEGLTHIIKQLAEKNEKIELKPKTLYQWK